MAYQVEVIETGVVFEVNPEEKILEAAARQGIKIYSDCQFGGCGTCRVKVVQGSVHYEDDFLPMSLSEEEHAEGFAAACQALATENIKISLANHLDTLPDTHVLSVEVVSVQAVCPGVRELRLQGAELAQIAYLPGQYLNILFNDGRARSFSMAGATATKGEIRLFIREIEGGQFTQRVLPHLEPAQVLQVEMPLGTFYYRERDWRPMICMATGTGIAPIRAILESLLDNKDNPPIHLYWGMRTEADLYLRDELEAWSARLGDFEFTPVLSQPSADWQGRVGYVQDAVAADYPDVSEYAFYLCGAPAMIDEATSKLKAAGAHPDFIYADAFTFQSESAVVSA